MGGLTKQEAFDLAAEMERQTERYGLTFDRFTVEQGWYRIEAHDTSNHGHTFESRQQWNDWKDGIDATEEYLKRRDDSQEE